MDHFKKYLRIRLVIVAVNEILQLAKIERFIVYSPNKVASSCEHKELSIPKIETDLNPNNQRGWYYFGKSTHFIWIIIMAKTLRQTENLLGIQHSSGYQWNGGRGLCSLDTHLNYKPI